MPAIRGKDFPRAQSSATAYGTRCSAAIPMCWEQLPPRHGPVHHHRHHAADFHHPARTLGHDVEVWVAGGFAAAPFPKPPVRIQRFIPGAIARLNPGLSVAQAQAKLDAYAANLREQYPTDYPAPRSGNRTWLPLQQEIVGNSNLMLILLLTAVAAVLLIACVNIASLLLARSSTRYREIAIRQALGASSWRLIRQTLTESLVLALAGGVLAVPVSFGLKNLLLTLVPSNLPRLSEIALNGRALLFAFLVSLLTGVLFGIAPAVQMSDQRLMDKLNQGSRGVGIGSRQTSLPRCPDRLRICPIAGSLDRCGTVAAQLLEGARGATRLQL